MKVPFSRVLDSGEVASTTVTPLFENVLAHFHETWWCIEPIRYYIIMPDHLHLIIKMRDVDGRVSVAVVVRQLMKALAMAISHDNTPNKIFEFEWHDWIVKKDGQLDAFRRYIAENPRRLALRRANRRYFTKAREIAFHGARYWAYGNEALLKLPVMVAIKGHRSPSPNMVLPGGSLHHLPIWFCRAATLHLLPTWFCRAASLHRFPTRFCRVASLHRFPTRFCRAASVPPITRRRIGPSTTKGHILVVNI